jgi:hypothetical protein
MHQNGADRGSGDRNSQVSEGIYNPGNVGLFTYAANNPVILKDSNGRNWFKVGGNYEWHPGSTYKGTKSNYTHFVEFTKTGTNDVGASVGTLKLYEQDKVIAEDSMAFSGGNGNSPLAEGTYKIRLEERGRAEGPADLKPGLTGDDEELKQHYGIQEIAPEDPAHNWGNFQYQWGSVRAYLNPDPGETAQRFRGNYLHGKDPEAGNYTHGCVCNRSENVLHTLLGLNSEAVPKVPVQVKGTGAEKRSR